MVQSLQNQQVWVGGGGEGEGGVGLLFGSLTRMVLTAAFLIVATTFAKIFACALATSLPLAELLFEVALVLFLDLVTLFLSLALAIGFAIMVTHVPVGLGSSIAKELSFI